MMKRYMFLLFLLVAFISCEDREPQAVLVPEWIKPRLAELDNSGDCVGCTVQRWTYREEYYYHLYCNYWSCLDCEIYRYDGTLVDWTLIDHADFDANKSRPAKIWECGDEL